MGYSLPGSSVHRILQVRILEWVAMASPWPPLGDFPYPGIEPTSLILLYRQSGSLPPPGKFINATTNNKNHRSPTLVTSSDPNYLPKAPPPNTITLRLQHMNGVGGVGWGNKHSVHNKALWVLGLFSRSPWSAVPCTFPQSGPAQVSSPPGSCCGRLGLHDSPLDVCSSWLLIWQTLHIQGSHTVEA